MAAAFSRASCTLSTNAFKVGLAKIDNQIVARRPLDAALFDVFQRLGAVNFGLLTPRRFKLGPFKMKMVFCICFPPIVPRLDRWLAWTC